jgi:hypothetical protein
MRRERWGNDWERRRGDGERVEGWEGYLIGNARKIQKIHIGSVKWI